MKKTILFSIFILIFGNYIAEGVNYVVPANLKGIGYAAHTELTWDNRVGFVYEIYRSEDVNSNFSKIAESDKDS